MGVTGAPETVPMSGVFAAAGVEVAGELVVDRKPGDLALIGAILALNKFGSDLMV